MFKLKGRKIAALALALVLAVSGLTGCGSSDSSTDTSDTATDTSSDELQVIKIGVGGTDDQYTIEAARVAYEEGYFEEELNEVGYTIEFYAFTSTGSEVNEAIASGDLDGAIYGDFPAFTSKSNGIDTTIIATANQRQQYSILSASDEVASAEDLEGHSIIVLQGSVQQYFWEKYVEATGIDGDNVEIINTSDAVSLLSTGSADAAAGNTYANYYYMESIENGAMIDDGSNYDIYTTMVVTLTNSLLEESPEVAVAINKALIRAYETAAADPESYYETVATTNISAEIMKTAYEFDESLWYLSPEIADDTMEYYEELNQWFVDSGIIQSEVDLDELIDTQYYYQAAEELSAE